MADQERERLLLKAMETAFRAGFSASAEQLGWTEDEAWEHACVPLRPFVAALLRGPRRERDEWRDRYAAKAMEADALRKRLGSGPGEEASE